MTRTRGEPMRDVPERCAAVFLPAESGEPPRAGRFAFWRPDGRALADPVDGGRRDAGRYGADLAAARSAAAFADGGEGGGTRGEITVVRRHGRGARTQAVPAYLLPVADALAPLTRARRAPEAHPAAAAWGAAALHALRLVGRARLLPGIGGGDLAIWRAGPLDAEDVTHLRAVAAAFPVEAHAVPIPGSRPPRLPDPESLLRAFLDAVADALPRTPAARYAAGGPFAASEPLRLPGAHEWAAEVAAGLDAGVGLSLRLDLGSADVFDTGDASDAGTGAAPAGGRGEEAGHAAAVVQVHSLDDPARVVDAAALWAEEDGAAGEPLGPAPGPRARRDTLLAVRRAARVWPPLERLLHRPVPDVLPLTGEELDDLLGRAATRLRAAGVAVHWPRRVARELTATAVVRPAPGSATDGIRFFHSEEPFEFRWQLALGGEQLTDAEMDALAESHRPIVRLRGHWVPVDPALVRKARKRHLGLLDPVRALAVTLSGSTEIDGETVEAVPAGALARVREELTGQPGGRPMAPARRAPEGLRATLRDYQATGVDWLERMTSLGLGGCLADDMGLGKTVTLIALHLRRAHPLPTLVVCPASLLGNWEREIERFAPGVPVRRFHGADRTLEGLPGEAPRDEDELPEPGGPADPTGRPDLPQGPGGSGTFGQFAPSGPSGPDRPGRDAGATAGFVLTTYGTLRSSATALAAHRWGLVVADEAQHVKNPHSATAEALRTLRAPARVALTGTPVENNLSELWALLDWTTPGLLGPLRAFRARHARAVEGGEDPEAVERLARLVRPFLLRRRKTDPGIAPELPPRTETDHAVPLSREQAGLYAAVVRETMDLIAAAEGMARRGLVMRLLTALKQICNHPAQYLRGAAPAGLPTGAGRAGGEPVGSGSRSDQRSGAGAGTGPDRGRSGKLELLDELLDTIVAEGAAALVFTQYVEMARLLEGHLTARGVPVQLLHGGTPVARREEMVARFQDGAVPVFLLSLKAAGTGLNLTRASHVVHYDRWWNPAVEDQATDRAHRIGQTQPVQVHRLVTEGTVEERIAELLESKQELADAVLGVGGEGALTELSDSALADLVRLRSTS